MAKPPKDPRRIDGILEYVPSLLDAIQYARSDYDPRFHPGNPSNIRVKDPLEFRPNVTNLNTLTPINQLTLQDLVGRPYVTTMSDLTAAGGLLEGIGDTPLAHPIRLTGGQDFMRENPVMWASGTKPTADIVAAGRELFDRYGHTPVYMPFQMGPKGGDFAHMTGQTMLSWAGRNMPENNRSQLNKKLELFIPDFVGVEDPYSLVQYGELSDKNRKAVQQMLDTEFRNLGGISLPQARLAVSDQTQLFPRTTGLRNVGVMDLSAGVIEGGGNPTYPDAVAGNYLGTLDTDVTALDLDPYKLARATNKDGTFREGPEGFDFASTRQDALRAMQLSPFGGIITQEKVDDLESRGFKVKANPLVTVTAGIATMMGLGVPAEEAEAAVLSGTFENTLDVAKTFTRQQKKIEEGKELTSGDMFPGRGGQTFVTSQQEATARIYDEFRRQISEFNEPLFDKSDAGQVSIGGSERIDGVSRYTFPKEYQKTTREIGVSTPDLIEINSGDSGAKLFREKILEAKDASKFGASVEAYDVDSYKNMRLFLTEDGSAGYALKPDGDIVSAFSKRIHPGIAPHLVMHGIEQGGKKLDAFDTVLPNMYAQIGMRETSRLRFDPDQAPADWDQSVFSKFQGGQPDVSFMALDRDFAMPVQPQMVDDYGEALARQEEALGLLDSPVMRGDDPLSIMPAPQRFFDPESGAYKPFVKGDFERGGRYLSMGEGQRDVSGMYPESASISISPEGKPSFQVSGQSATGLPSQEGRKIKSNLFKKSAGWNWTKVPEGFDPNPDKGFSLVSVEDGSKHYYALSSSYPDGVNLQRYPMSKDEPRLRPTKKGEVVLGNVVGEIEVRGKTHPVYDNVTVQSKKTSGAVKAATVTTTGLLAATASGESDASIIGQMSKLGASRADLKGMAIKMAAEGMSPEEIIQKTGWYQGPLDGMWRTELPNTKTKINLPELMPLPKSSGRIKYEPGQSVIERNITEVIDDPALLEQYDLDYRKEYGLTAKDQQQKSDWFQMGSLKKIKIVFDKNLPPGAGWHARSGFYGPNGELEPETITVSGLSSPQEIRSIILHELQHAIQNREAFAPGSDTRYYEKDKYLASKWNDALDKRLEELEAKNKKLLLHGDELKSYYRLRSFKNHVDRHNEEVARVGSDNPFDLYRSAAGEVEARNVELRDKALSPQGLMENPPFTTEDIPTSSQTYRARENEVATFESMFDVDKFYRQPNMQSRLQDNWGVEMKRVQKQSGDIVAKMMADNAKRDELMTYAEKIRDRKQQIDRYKKMVAETRKEMLEPGLGALIGEIAVRETEGFAKMLIGLPSVIIDPDSTFYDEVTQSKSILGEPSNRYNDTMETIASGMRKYVVDPVSRGLEYKGSDEKTIKQEIAETVQPAVDAYNKLPDYVKEEVMPRLGYAGMLVGSLFGFGLTTKAKKVVGKKGEGGLLGRLSPLEGELVDELPAVQTQPVGLLQ